MLQKNPYKIIKFQNLSIQLWINLDIQTYLTITRLLQSTSESSSANIKSAK